MEKTIKIVLKGLLTAFVLFISVYVGFFVYLILFSEDYHTVLCYIGMVVLPSLIVPLIWTKKRKAYIKYWGAFALAYVIAIGINCGIMIHDREITIDTAPNIEVGEYLPFDENSKIVKLDSKTLDLTENLPVIDGAAAVFPVYSAFVNAVYPETTRLHDGVFEYNNTTGGYKLLGEKATDIFFGAYPSEEQINDAKLNNTTFEYTPIGLEAFVFFVHKDNPINNLSAEQIKSIYAGEITNWSEVGGNNEKIMAFQRNEGSGSQSMLKRFMDGKKLMEPPSELVNDLMSGIIERVADYKSRTNSIGFSFRYYVEGIIKNPDIKLISVDGTAPTVENIKCGKYPIVAPLYAVTYAEQDNENVDKLIDWILSEEGQYIIEETGYVGIANE